MTTDMKCLSTEAGLYTSLDCQVVTKLLKSNIEVPHRPTGPGARPHGRDITDLSILVPHVMGMHNQYQPTGIDAVIILQVKQ